MKRLLVILFGLFPIMGFSQYMKYPSHYNAQEAAEQIIRGKIGMFLNDTLTEVVVEKKNDRWVTSYHNKETIIKKVNKVLDQGESRYTGRTNGGYRFYINIYDGDDDTKVLHSLDITIDAASQKIKTIEIKL